jgi:hypothetical protein
MIESIDKAECKVCMLLNGVEPTVIAGIDNA